GSRGEVFDEERSGLTFDNSGVNCSFSNRLAGVRQAFGDQVFDEQTFDEQSFGEQRRSRRFRWV
uniref:Uncharacterized protein n=1 Tax=Cucumis melo TaxID=3656 RepID=A0A9I9E268_CUCME